MKETFYFSHDYNAQQDPKMMELLSECGLSGVGAYWIIIEQLHQQEDGKITDTQLKSYLKFYYSFNSDGEQLLNKIEQVLFSSKLLLKDDDGSVYSSRVTSHKNERKKLSEARSEAGRKSAEKRRKSTSVKQKSTSVEQNPTKERKGKERKRNNSLTF